MSRKRREAAAGALLAVILGFAAYSGVGEAGFVQDDVPIIQLNPIVREGNVARIFATDWWAGVGGQDASLYRPMTLWSFALQRGPGGEVDPAGAHRLNLAFHLATSLLVLLLALRLGAGPRIGAAAAILFAVHPIHAAAVAGLVGRAEILAAMFGLAAIGLMTYSGPWARPGPATATPGAWSERAAAWGAAICVFLAACSKETGLLVPILLVILEILFRPRPRGSLKSWIVDRAAALAPSALATTLVVVLRVRALDAFPGLQRVNAYENPIVGLDGLERIATAIGLLGRYLVLHVWPGRLSADYSGHAIAAEASLVAIWPIAGILGLALLAGLATAPWVVERHLRRERLSNDRWSIVAYSAWLFLVPYAVVSNLAFPVGQIFAERFVYAPSVGFCLLVPLLAAVLTQNRPLARLGLAAMVVVALAGVVRTRAAVEDWRTDESLYEAARRAVPDAPRASFTLAKIRLSQGRTDEALLLLDETLRLWPEQSGAWVDKGTILARRGDFEGAERAFRAAARVNPYNQRAVVSFGLVLSRLGRREEAERVLAIAVRRFPEDEVARAELAALRGAAAK